MKRSLFDPLPRQLSTKALAVLVALVLSGTGIAVARYLDSDPHTLRSPEVHAAPSEEAGSEEYRRSAPSFRPSSGLTSAPARGGTWGGTGGVGGCSTSSAPSRVETRGAAACAPSSPKSESPTTFRATAADG